MRLSFTKHTGVSWFHTSQGQRYTSVDRSILHVHSEITYMYKQCHWTVLLTYRGKHRGKSKYQTGIKSKTDLYTLKF